MPVRLLILISRAAHRPADLGGLVGQIVAHPVLVVGEVERHPQHRAAERVALGRVEVEVIAAVAHHRAVGHDRRRSSDNWPRPRCLHSAPHFGVLSGTGWVSIGRRAGVERADIAAADEAQPAMVEIVAVEIVDDHARARPRR